MRDRGSGAAHENKIYLQRMCRGSNTHAPPTLSQPDAQGLLSEYRYRGTDNPLAAAIRAQLDKLGIE